MVATNTSTNASTVRTPKRCKASKKERLVP